MRSNHSMVTGETTVTKVNINPPTGFVAIPTTASGGPQGPTGQVNNANTSSFPVAHDDGTDGTSARFIFANLNGTISAWDTGPTAFVQNSGADGTVYTGLAINRAQTLLYAANTSLGRIDVFDSNFAALDLGPDAFVDPSLPDGQSRSTCGTSTALSTWSMHPRVARPRPWLT